MEKNEIDLITENALERLFWIIENDEELKATRIQTMKLLEENRSEMENAILDLQNTVFKSFAIMLHTSSNEEQEFITNSGRMFINIFNRSALIIKRLLVNK